MRQSALSNSSQPCFNQRAGPLRPVTLPMIPAMKKLLTLSLVALFSAATVRADDAHTPRSDLVVRVETCEAIVPRVHGESRHRHPGVASGRREPGGIMILNQFKAGFLFGVKGGYGVHATHGQEAERPLEPAGPHRRERSQPWPAGGRQVGRHGLHPHGRCHAAPPLHEQAEHRRRRQGRRRA